MPSELALAIMAWLPAKSLLRFRCVCKPWRDTISHDPAFRHDHLRLQTSRLLISTSSEEDHEDKVTTVGFYLSEESPALTDTTDLPLEDDLYHVSHCDGLVLLPTQIVVRVLNPARRRVLLLPWSPNGIALAPTEGFHSLLHQVFGIGYDPRKRHLQDRPLLLLLLLRRYKPVVTDQNYHHKFGMEVFTIGVDEHWRETVVPPPYPVDITGTSAFFMDSLFWTIDHDELELEGGESPLGFLRFRLTDESFGVIPPPPSCQGLVYEMSYLAELRGELSVAHPGTRCESIEIWTCNDVDTNPPQWTRRYMFNNYCPHPAKWLDIAMHNVCKDIFILQVLKNIVGVDRLLYHPHDSVIPYIPSLVPI
ncbi:hypothetical protein ZWY2020_031478 [Hordeum vulgare]|nr:hypothetical protein ZWY2020_031478 [Hordeum vulgare]